MALILGSGTSNKQQYQLENPVCLINNHKLLCRINICSCVALQHVKYRYIWLSLCLTGLTLADPRIQDLSAAA